MKIKLLSVSIYRTEVLADWFSMQGQLWVERSKVRRGLWGERVKCPGSYAALSGDDGTDEPLLGRRTKKKRTMVKRHACCHMDRKCDAAAANTS